MLFGSASPALDLMIRADVDLIRAGVLQSHVLGFRVSNVYSGSCLRELHLIYGLVVYECELCGDVGCRVARSFS